MFSDGQWFEIPISLSDKTKEEILNFDIANAKDYHIHEPEENHRLEFLEIPLEKVQEAANKFMLSPTKATLVVLPANSGIPWHIDGQSHDYHRPTIACFPIFPNSKTYTCTEYKDGIVPYCNYVFNTKVVHKATAGEFRRLNLQIWFDEDFSELEELHREGKLLI